MAARAVIGRDNELAALEAFWPTSERGPTALELSGEAGIDWEVGVGEALTPKDR
jgi:hypothetical protein